MLKSFFNILFNGKTKQQPRINLDVSHTSDMKDPFFTVDINREKTVKENINNAKSGR